VRTRFERLFPGQEITLVDGVDTMAAAFDALGPQRPATCGAYALTYLFPALGFTHHGGHDLAAEDYLAHLAAVAVEADEIPVSDEITRRVRSGELSEAAALTAHGREWYRYPVRWSADPVASGTSPAGVARAVEAATAGSWVAMPVAARDEAGDEQLDEDRWCRLLEALKVRAAAWRWHAIFNYESDQMLRPDDARYTVANLAAADVLDRIPRDVWGVGHFVGLAGLWRMGGDGPWWLLLLDTYKHRGFEGYQPQPAELMRRAMARTDGREGGMLLILPRGHVARAESMLAGLGISDRMWSNGSLEPHDWAWQPDRG
jgi:hypothetical protein